MTIELPEQIADRLTALVPEGERDRFVVAAIADALLALPDVQPDRDAAECMAAVEEALIEMEAGRGLLSFEEVCRQWERGRTS